MDGTWNQVGCVIKWPVGRVCVQTFEETERRHWANMENEWEQEKQKILTALVGTGQDMLDFPQESQVTYHSVTAYGQ